MIRYFQRSNAGTNYLNHTTRRHYQTKKNLIVSQERGSNDCTRASIATILNHTKNQAFADIGLVNKYLLERCETYRLDGIDGLQPALESKAAYDLFLHYKLYARKLRYNHNMLLAYSAASELEVALKGGMILATCQPPGNSVLVSHSVVITDVFVDPITKQISYNVFDPYPRPDRDLYGIRRLSSHDVAKEKLTADIFVSSN